MFGKFCVKKCGNMIKNIYSEMRNGSRKGLEGSMLKFSTNKNEMFCQLNY